MGTLWCAPRKDSLTNYAAFGSVHYSDFTSYLNKLDANHIRTQDVSNPLKENNGTNFVGVRGPYLHINPLIRTTDRL